MMTAAVLCSAWRGSTRGIRGVNHEQREQFLKEVGGLLGKDTTTSSPLTLQSTLSKLSLACSRDDGDSMDHGEKQTTFLRDMPRTPSFPSNPHTCATRIQAQFRRYWQQRHYRIHQLQQRLHQIPLEKQRQLAHIQLRRDRKLAKIQRKHARKERQLEQQYQKVAGIVHYLQRDKNRCRKELENHRSACREVKADNQRLFVTQQRTQEAIHHCQQHQIDPLEGTNKRLQTTLLVQKEACQALERELVQARAVPLISQPQPLQSRPPPQDHHKAKCSYESSIKVNCVNEVEENCFHYRLVQDVYTLTPSAG